MMIRIVLKWLSRRFPLHWRPNVHGWTVNALLRRPTPRQPSPINSCLVWFSRVYGSTTGIRPNRVNADNFYPQDAMLFISFCPPPKAPPFGGRQRQSSAGRVAVPLLGGDLAASRLCALALNSYCLVPAEGGDQGEATQLFPVEITSPAVTFQQLPGWKFHFRSSLVIFGNLRSSLTPSAPVIGKLTNILKPLVFFRQQASTPLQICPQPHGAHRSTGSFHETESVFMSSCVRIPARPEVLTSAFLRAKLLPHFTAITAINPR